MGPRAEDDGRIVEVACIISGEITLGGEFGAPAVIGRVFTRSAPLEAAAVGRLVGLGFTNPPLPGGVGSVDGAGPSPA